MDGEPQSGCASLPSPGAALATARVEQGLTVEDVAERLKLAAFQVRAIEDDDFGALPGAIFARGFVRSYARLLNVNVESLLSAMTPQGASKTPDADARLLRDVKGVVLGPVRFRGWPIAAGSIIAGVVGVLVFYEFVLNESQSIRTLAATQTVPAPVAPAATAALPVPPAPTVEPVASREDVQKLASDDGAAGRQLHFLFSRESWVEVRDGLGKILVSQTNLPGTEQSVRGQPPFNVIVGNARGVQLAYNGNPVNLAAHATEDVARLRLE